MNRRRSRYELARYGVGDDAPGWTRESIRDTGAEFRRLVYAWQWPEATLDLYDSPNTRAMLREMRETAQRTVDQMTRQADREANAGRLSDASSWLGQAADFWARFEERARSFEHLANETTIERTARYVDETQQAVSDTLAEAGQAVQGAALGAGAGIAIVAALALYVISKK